MRRDSLITKSIEAKQEGDLLKAYKLEAETEKAIGLPTIPDDKDPIWLPKSEIHAVKDRDGRVFAYVPRWLVDKKETHLLQKTKKQT